VQTGKPQPADINEPKRVAESIKLMKVKHAVITSVDRDDLKDGGSKIWAMTIKEIRRLNPTTTMEALIPDFKANSTQIQRIIDAAPEVVSHNIETVKRLTKKVRIQAKYERSLETLNILSNSGMRTKSGIMLGLGENEKEVIETIQDLRNVGISILTLGQYLQPTLKHLPVAEYINPKQFQELKEIALQMGFKVIESGPLVRSSYHAEKHLF
jgi:lipoic acid synthetase